MKASEFKARYLLPQYQKRFCVISFHNDRQWISLPNNEEVPKNMMAGLRMMADPGAWEEYEKETGNTEGES